MARWIMCRADKGAKDLSEFVVQVRQRRREGGEPVDVSVYDQLEPVGDAELVID